MPKKRTKKLAPKPDKLKLELKQLRKDLIKAKKSKLKLQHLWYRTKKEHVALLKDIEKRLKALKKSLSKKSPARK
jgi:hypothetical protein